MDSTDLRSICRICLTSSITRMTSIFTVEPESGLQFIDKILQSTNIEIVQNENLPDKICSPCLRDVETAYQLRMNIESSNQVLLSYLEQIEDKPDDEQSQEENPPPPSEADVEESTQEQQEIDQVYDIPEDFEVVEAEEQEEEENVIHVLKKLTPNEKLPVVKRNVIQSKDKEGNSLIVLQFERDQGEKKNDPFACRICSAVFKRKSALKSHLQRHQGTKQFQCAECQKNGILKAFTLAVELKRHMRVHTGEKPFACQYCNKSFSDYGTRVKHLRTHTGERPYQCRFPDCQKRFAYSNVLKFHEMTHTGERNYACTVCDRKFIKQHQLKCHLATHGIGESTSRRRGSRKPPKERHLGPPLTSIVDTITLHDENTLQAVETTEEIEQSSNMGTNFFLIVKDED